MKTIVYTLICLVLLQGCGGSSGKTLNEQDFLNACLSNMCKAEVHLAYSEMHDRTSDKETGKQILGLRLKQIFEKYPNPEFQMPKSTELEFEEF